MHADVSRVGTERDIGPRDRELWGENMNMRKGATEERVGTKEEGFGRG